MSLGPDHGARRVRALALKLAASLLVTGAVVAAALAFALSRFVTGSDVGPRLLPLGSAGSTIGMAPAIALLIAAALGIALAATRSARRAVSHIEERVHAETDPPTRQAARRRRRAIVILVVGLAVLASVLGLRWARTVPAGLPSVHPADTSRP